MVSMDIYSSHKNYVIPIFTFSDILFDANLIFVMIPPISCSS